MSYKTLPDFSLPDITLRTLLSSRKFSRNKTLQGQISPGTILSSRNWKLSQDITLQGQNSPGHNSPEDKTLRLQNSPGTKFSGYKFLPAQNCPGTKLSLFKTNAYWKLGIFTLVQNSPVCNFATFHIGTKFSHMVKVVKLHLVQNSPTGFFQIFT